LKGPNPENSFRKQYLTTPLLNEIRKRIEEIERYKAVFGDEYRDYGLLLCQPDGRPIDPKSLNARFKDRQRETGIEVQIEFQGLRKSGQMHKVRLTQNNYQLVAESSGQSPEVLMSNYNDVLDAEKRALSVLVENIFYPKEAVEPEPETIGEAENIMRILDDNPGLMRHILQSLLTGAVRAQ